MARKPNAWMVYLANFKKKHPNMKFTEAAKEAAKTYKSQAGGSALGGELSHSDFKADPHYPSTGTAVQAKAVLYSGGAKKSRRSKSKSHRKSKTHRKSRSRRS